METLENMAFANERRRGMSGFPLLTRRQFSLAPVLSSLAGGLLAQAPRARRPNVVLIVLDDLGFADLGCYGSEIRTPNIDRLAASGLRYNNFHTTALCSPSRACLLTGRNHHTVGVRTITNYASQAENNRGKITERAATLPQILLQGGYNTFALGKWHLAPIWETTAAGPYDNWPLAKGFERYYGFLDGGTDQFHPELVEDNHWVDPPRCAGYHLTEDLADHAIAFLRDQQSVRPDKPFFLYLAPGAPHAPHQAPKEFIDRYRGAYDVGWDRIRGQRFARMKLMGVIPADADLAPRNEGVRPWNDLGADDRRVFARFQEAYAGFVEHADYHIGRVLDFLARLHQQDNAIVMLMSDNGASGEGGPNGTFSILRGVNGIETSAADNLAHIDDIGTDKLENHYPQGWAQVGNTPFQRYKQSVHYGGIRDPLVVSWPEGIKDRGAIRPQFHHIIDILPTVLEAAGLRAPEVYRGVQQIPVAGISMQYTFADASAPGRRSTQYFEMQGNRGIYHDGWKAVVFHNKGVPFDKDRWELYRVAEDFSEVHDLAAARPEKLQEMQALFLSEARRYGVLPLDDRTQELRLEAKPDAPQNRNHFVYYAGMAHVTPSATPDTRNRSYEITALVERPDRWSDGVLVAFGGATSGYVLYILNNRLVHEYDAAGTVYKVESNAEVPAGKSTLRFTFEKTGDLQGWGRLSINGRAAGEVFMPRTLPVMISYEGLDVGRDSLSPVSESYRDRGEFPFQGTIEAVIFDLK
jgi:arylsulfatase